MGGDICVEMTSWALSCVRPFSTRLRAGEFNTGPCVESAGKVLYGGCTRRFLEALLASVDIAR